MKHVTNQLPRAYKQRDQIFKTRIFGPGLATWPKRAPTSSLRPYKQRYQIFKTRIFDTAAYILGTNRWLSHSLILNRRLQR